MSEGGAALRPRDHVEEITALKFGGDWAAVHAMATEIWAAWVSGAVTDPVGLAAVCQVAFTNAMDMDVPDDAPDGDPRRVVAAQAQLWRARAYGAAAQTGEIDTVAMLLLPVAFQARDLGFLDTALEIVDEIDRLAGVVADRADLPGIPPQVIRRAAREKKGYLLWRAQRYEEAIAAYEAAMKHVAGRQRDRVRVEGGLLLSELGAAELAGVEPDWSDARRRFAELEEQATACGSADVAKRLKRNVELIVGGLPPVQDLVPMEME